MFRYLDKLKTRSELSQWPPLMINFESWVSMKSLLSTSWLGSNHGPAIDFFVLWENRMLIRRFYLFLIFSIYLTHFGFSNDGSFSNENKLVIERSYACQPFTPNTPLLLMLMSGSDRPCCMNDLVWLRGMLMKTIGSNASFFGSSN